MDKFLVTIGEDEYTVTAEQLAELDLTQTSTQHFHLLLDNNAHQCELLQFDAVTKTMSLRLNGKQHQLKIGDRYDQMVKKMGLNVAAATSSSDVFAPMPGLILDVLVEAGQKIEAGTPLLILEAMKMENVIKADGEGEVKSISVKKGEAVDKKQLLIEIA